MRKLFFIFYFFLIFLFLVGAIAPSVSAICSIGASPLEMTANAKPGQTVELAWNIINLRGDRPTHVLISQTEGPNWKVEYNPEASIVEYEVAGILTETEETFAVPQSEVVKEKPDKLPSGKLAYIAHPNVSEGYILVDKQVKIYIEIPENAEIGKLEEFVFTAKGSCFGETGAVSASLATELKVKILPVTEYYEKPAGSGITGNVIGEFFGDNPGLSVVFGVLLLVIVGLVVYVVRLKKK